MSTTHTTTAKLSNATVLRPLGQSGTPAAYAALPAGSALLSGTARTLGTPAPLGGFTNAVIDLGDDTNDIPNPLPAI